MSKLRQEHEQLQPSRLLERLPRSFQLLAQFAQKQEAATEKKRECAGHKAKRRRGLA